MAQAKARVVVSLVENDGKVLLIHRRNPEHGLGWTFPGGKVEDRESEKAATRREVMEEVGIACRPTRKLGQRRHPDTGSVISYWVCQYQGGEPRVVEEDKFDQVAWMAPEEFLRAVTTDVSPFVRDYLTSLQVE
ncbi:NUDIX hydrolase [Novispirillum sp. DQ9]|uniref:NUDIX hydrolase n=1 Tax=Novispirillum sp. DQ9 TaxID=3398612 RepID=UPI003C7CD914